MNIEPERSQYCEQETSRNELCCVVAPQRATRAENRNSEFEQIVLLRQSHSESRGVESKAEKAL